MTREFLAPFLALVLKPRLRSLAQSAVLAAVFAVVLTVALATFQGKSFFRWEIDLVSWAYPSSSSFESPERHDARERFVVEVAGQARSEMLKIPTSYSVPLLGILLGTNLTLWILPVIGQGLLLYSRGVVPLKSFGGATRLSGLYNVINRLGAVWITGWLVAMVWWNLHSEAKSPVRILPFLWSACLPYLAWYAIAAIRTYRNFRTSGNGGTRQYFLVSGGITALQIIIAGVLLNEALTLLPRVLSDVVGGYRDTVVHYSRQRAEMLLEPMDRVAALDIIERQLLAPSDISAVWQILVEPLRVHIAILLLLASYVFLAAPLCAFRYPKHPHRMFFGYGTLATAGGFVINFALRRTYGGILDSELARYMLALVGTGVGFYLGLLLSPLQRGQKRASDR